MPPEDYVTKTQINALREEMIGLINRRTSECMVEVQRQTIEMRTAQTLRSADIKSAVAIILSVASLAITAWWYFR